MDDTSLPLSVSRERYANAAIVMVPTRKHKHRHTLKISEMSAGFVYISKWSTCGCASGAPLAFLAQLRLFLGSCCCCCCALFTPVSGVTWWWAPCAADGRTYAHERAHTWATRGGSALVVVEVHGTRRRRRDTVATNTVGGLVGMGFRELCESWVAR